MDFVRLLKEPELLDKNILKEIEDIVDRYPYFQIPRIVLLKNLYLKNKERFVDELKKSTVFISDRKQLFLYLNGSVNFEDYVSNIKMELLDELTFIDKDKEDILEFDEIGLKVDYNVENESVEKILKDTDSNNSVIDEFIKLSPKITRDSSVDSVALIENKENIDECFTETLAKIYVKQKLYDKAIAVYEKLSLKNPQKSVYFVDRVKEIEKLIKDKL